MSESSLRGVDTIRSTALKESWHGRRSDREKSEEEVRAGTKSEE
jgi:hypothetical protein